VLGDAGRGELRIAVVTSTVDGPAPGVSSGAITFIAVVNVDVDRTSIAPPLLSRNFNYLLVARSALTELDLKSIINVRSQCWSASVIRPLIAISTW